MFTKQYGKYDNVGTPNMPEWYTPQVDHGTSGENNVPPSSIHLDNMFLESPSSSNFSLYMVAGMIKLKYWSHIVRIVNIAVQITRNSHLERCSDILDEVS